MEPQDLPIEVLHRIATIVNAANPAALEEEEDLLEAGTMAATTDPQRAVGDWIASSPRPINCNEIKCYAKRTTRPAMSFRTESLNCFDFPSCRRQESGYGSSRPILITRSISKGPEVRIDAAAESSLAQHIGGIGFENFAVCDSRGKLDRSLLESPRFVCIRRKRNLMPSGLKRRMLRGCLSRVQHAHRSKLVPLYFMVSLTGAPAAAPTIPWAML